MKRETAQSETILCGILGHFPAQSSRPHTYCAEKKCRVFNALTAAQYITNIKCIYIKYGALGSLPKYRADCADCEAAPEPTLAGLISALFRAFPATLPTAGTPTQ